MEHVGRHLEKMDPGPEAEDLELRDWMFKEGLLEYTERGWRVQGLGSRRRRGKGKCVKDGGGDGDRDEIGRVEVEEGGEEDAEGEDDV